MPLEPISKIVDHGFRLVPPIDGGIEPVEIGKMSDFIFYGQRANVLNLFENGYVIRKMTEAAIEDKEAGDARQLS